MQSVSKILEHRQQVTSSAETIPTGETDSALFEKQIVNHLFSRLASIFPAWKSAFDSKEAVRETKQIWLQALKREGINSTELIDNGLRRAIESRSPFLPTIGQFIDWCLPTPEDLGLPSASSAWIELCNRNRAPYSCGVVYAARCDRRCDVFNWRQFPMEKGLKLFEPIYREYVQRASKGESFEQPAGEIEDQSAVQSNVEISDEQKVQTLSELRRSLRS